MSDSESTPLPPIVFLIPEATLEQLRARRDQRRSPPPTGGNDPILNTVELAVNAGQYDIAKTARLFCDGMDRLQIEVEDKYDAFLLDPGMGPMTYLTADGRILSDYRIWDGEGIQFETTLERAVPALVVGAKNTGIQSLLELIPSLPNSTICNTCHGSRWFRFGTRETREIVCPTCSGLGQCMPGKNPNT